MKFLEFTTIHGNVLTINLDYLICLKYESENEYMFERYYIVFGQSDCQYQLSKEEYERITQYIDKVDHL